MPSVAIIFNVLPINCEDGFDMIYRIQGDEAISLASHVGEAGEKRVLLWQPQWLVLLPTERWEKP